MGEETVERKDLVSHTDHGSSLLVEGVDLVRPGEVEGACEEDELEVVYEDLQVNGEGRLLRPSTADGELHEQHYSCECGERDERDEEDVLPRFRTPNALELAVSRVVGFTLGTQYASVALSALPKLRVRGRESS